MYKPGLRSPPEGPPGNPSCTAGSGKLSANLDSTAFRMTASNACPKVSAWPVMDDFSRLGIVHIDGHKSQRRWGCGKDSNTSPIDQSTHHWQTMQSVREFWMGSSHGICLAEAMASFPKHILWIKACVYFIPHELHGRYVLSIFMGSRHGGGTYHYKILHLWWAKNTAA